ncbi:hypothetical protein GCM10010910_01180 [Microbacterium nanhaiense]|uniref:Uncharacterized protein n=1 Tax=Microbacterium nanhaiense TaxID=1301026 RepID=A0ABQ2MWG5_9MICO|nr:hypothetical protein [Microbacterium nanhaiense]GGO59083.1 hypothetical protein GCM10010910_01180 [Microbacterium nanhaiense]
MKRIWTIWGITALTGVILVGAVVFGAVACAGYAGDVASFCISIFGGGLAVFATGAVAIWLDDEVPR